MVSLANTGVASLNLAEPQMLCGLHSLGEVDYVARTRCATVVEHEATEPSRELRDSKPQVSAYLQRCRGQEGHLSDTISTISETLSEESGLGNEGILSSDNSNSGEPSDSSAAQWAWADQVDSSVEEYDCDDDEDDEHVSFGAGEQQKRQRRRRRGRGRGHQASGTTAVDGVDMLRGAAEGVATRSCTVQARSPNVVTVLDLGLQYLLRGCNSDEGLPAALSDEWAVPQPQLLMMPEQCGRGGYATSAAGATSSCFLTPPGEFFLRAVQEPVVSVSGGVASWVAECCPVSHSVPRMPMFTSSVYCADGNIHAR